MDYDYRLLKACIVERFGSEKRFAKSMGLTDKGLEEKLASQAFWQQAEIKQAQRLLALGDAEVKVYFFTLDVQWN